MVYKNRKKVIIVAVAVVALILVGLGVAYFAGAFTAKEADPYRQNSSQQATDDVDTDAADDDTDNTQTGGDDGTNSGESDGAAANDTDSSALDPETVATLPIEAAGITVSYVKGIGGFEYQVLRTQSGTEYIEFQSPELAGTKCTDDTGVFASIIISPSDAEDTSTLSQKVTVDGTVYGLSLQGSNCTGDTTLFAQYQDSFKRAFSLLKKIDTN